MTFKIIAISGDGAGAGKTYAARLFGQNTWTIADGMRTELQARYPDYNWFSREQEYKRSTLIRECDNKPMRRVLLEYGQSKCADNPCYWVERLCDSLDRSATIASGNNTIAIDDVRKVCEIDTLRLRFDYVTHIHVENPDAVHEPEFDAEQLKAMADYVVRWKK
jgi:hypothetical protein